MTPFTDLTATAVDTANGSFIADTQAVAVTPTAPTGLTATASGDSINVNFTTTSHISTGTTLLISMDGTTFYEASETTMNTSTGTIADLLQNTHYWIEAITDSVNGISGRSAAVQTFVADTAPQLVITPSGIPQQGQPYSLVLAATYALNTPPSEVIDHWLVNFGDVRGQQNILNIGNDEIGQVVASSHYSFETTTATVTIAAVEAGGTEINAPDESLLFAPPSPVNASFRTSADGTYTVISWQGTGDDYKYVIQRKDPGSSTWTTVTTIAATDIGSIYGYSYTDSDVNPVTGTGIGYEYRVASAAFAVPVYDPGTMGVSTYIEVPEDQPTSPSPGGIVYQNGTDEQGTTGNWSPADTQYASGQTATLTLNNLPKNMSVSIILYDGNTGYQTADDRFHHDCSRWHNPD